MTALDIKLLRDVRRLWAQVFAIALVVGGGVATLVLAVGSHRSLDETRTAYYERYAFADVFARMKRAPKALVGQIAEIPGVAAVDPRIAKLALLDIPGFAEPASGQFVSLPDTTGDHGLNRLYIRSGRLPEPGRSDEIAVNEPFARAHGFAEGSRFSAIRAPPGVARLQACEMTRFPEAGLSACNGCSSRQEVRALRENARKRRLIGSAFRFVRTVLSPENPIRSLSRRKVDGMFVPAVRGRVSGPSLSERKVEPSCVGYGCCRTGHPETVTT